MEFDKLLAHPSHRRSWLLLKALECGPLDHALDLARAADRFVVGDDNSEVDAFRPTSAVCTRAAEPSGTTDVAVERKPPAGRSSLLDLTPSQRAELVDRAANGAKNAELAAEFGLTPRQVQGLRMVAARVKRSSVELDTPDSTVDATAEGARVKRAALELDTPASTVDATAEEVVRYLRQRDDVVVPDRTGAFLVNGRFRLDLAELVAKANRARSRESKPLFKVRGITDEAKPSQTNGTPVAVPAGRSDPAVTFS